MVADGPVDGALFLAYGRTFWCPTLKPGDVVIAGNPSSHEVAGVVEAIEVVGATLVHLPPYSPNLNPIETFFAKPKALLRKAAKRTAKALWTEIGDVLESPEECSHYFHSAGYVTT
jgi:transposase